MARRRRIQVRNTEVGSEAAIAPRATAAGLPGYEPIGVEVGRASGGEAGRSAARRPGREGFAGVDGVGNAVIEGDVRARRRRR